MNNEIKRIRDLAKIWSKLANTDKMQEKRIAWTKLHDLKPIRPVCIIETELMTDFVTDRELQCTDPWLRSIETKLVHGIKHVNMLDDDYVLNPNWKTDYILNIDNYDYGVGLTYQQNGEAIVPNSPIKNVEQIKNLVKRKFSVDIEKSLKEKEKFEKLFDGLLPVQLQMSDFNLPQVTRYIFDLIGMENMYFWMIDEPEAIHSVARFVTDDYFARIKAYDYANALTLNDNNQYSGSGSLGFISNLKQSVDDKVRTKDMWVWIESQETTSISPAMFEEFYLPYLAEISKNYHYVYYGCCEQLHDRFDVVEKYINNIRCVSVSPWSDRVKMAELLGERYVYSLKLTPQFITQDKPNEDAQQKEIEQVYAALKNKRLIEYIYRDVYRFNNDPAKFQNWVNRVKQFF